MLDKSSEKPKRNRAGEVPPGIQRIVWARSAGRCQFENCNEDLIGHLVAGNRSSNRGFVAHIIGASVNGPRGDEVLSSALAKDPANVMLLCHGCHRIIDVERRDDYPAERLYQMKEAHEAWISRAVGLGMQSQSHVLRFTNRIESNETSIPMDECVRSLMAIGKTPATFRPIDLKVGLPGSNDSEDMYWAAEPSDLRRFFDERLKGRFVDGSIRHLSVFGFAPMPLLMLLGRLLPDLHDIEVFSRHREPSPTWVWKLEGTGFAPLVMEGPSEPKRVALKLEITDRIADSRITDVIGTHDLSIWSVTCSNPRHDAISTRQDMSEFRKTVLRAFNRLKEVHGEDVEVMVFPAAPAACCVEFGRVWQPKAHRPMEIFDSVQDQGFRSRLRID